MKTWHKVAIALVLLVVAAGVGALIWLNQDPPAPEELRHAVDESQRAQNGELQQLLYTLGFTDSMVDVTEERLYIAYELPPPPANHSAESDAPWEEDAQARILGSVLTLVAADRVLLLQYQNEEPALYWKLDVTTIPAGADAITHAVKKDFRAKA